MGGNFKANGLDSRMTVGAVLLAAGAGSRFGGRPKVLLELDGVPLVMRQLIALSGAGVEEIVVVLGHHADAVAAAVRPFPVTLACNPACVDHQSRDSLPAAPGSAQRSAQPPGERFAAGGSQASSVRIGLEALSSGLDAVIVALADQPLIDADDITALIGAFRNRGAAAMVVPRVRGAGGDPEPGNPVIIDGALRKQWLAGDAELTGRKWRRMHPERVHWFDTGNRRYCIDIDKPEDLERFATSTGRTLQWPPSLARGASG